MDLSRLKKLKGKTRKAKRLGRGYSSGKGGHTVGRGMKGQKSREGHNIPSGFEGGQTPLYKRLPQWGGFRNPTKKEIVSISLAKLSVFRSNTEVTPEDLVKKGILTKLPKHGVKILGNGNIDKKLTLKGFLTSSSAKEKIEKVGGTVK